MLTRVRTYHEIWFSPSGLPSGENHISVCPSSRQRIATIQIWWSHCPNNFQSSEYHTKKLLNVHVFRQSCLKWFISSACILSLKLEHTAELLWQWIVGHFDHRGNNKYAFAICPSVPQYIFFYHISCYVFKHSKTGSAQYSVCILICLH